MNNVGVYPEMPRRAAELKETVSRTKTEEQKRGDECGSNICSFAKNIRQVD